MQQNCALLPDQRIKGFQQGRRGVRIARIDVGQRRIEGFVPHRLPDQKSVRTLVYQEHRACVLQNVNVL